MSSAALEPAGVLPALREEIAIFPGPRALDGSPSWTLHDPVRNRFYRIGWPEFEILSRWRGGTPQSIAERVSAETTLEVDPAEVADVGRFLVGADLLSVNGPQGTALLLGKARRQRQGWGKWLLSNYLFIRIPLCRPDRFLSATYPLVRGLYSRPVAVAVGLLGLIGLYLIARQWDVFLATLVDLITVSGAIYFAITLAGLKVVHELGHAYTAKRFGCRVPTMGLAMLVLVPVLYTDVNDAWRLTSRRQRLAIGLAGVGTELCCAALAACAWGFLPNGPLRSAAFLVATSTWVTTVLLNLSPFMRYDGYYVLSDWLETPNLHARSFALARWWLRRMLFGLADEPPEDLPGGRRRFLIAFAIATWAYRFALFLAIALIVYHFAVKVLGVVMMVVEVGFFLVAPVVREAGVWMRRRGELRLNLHTVVTAALAAAAVTVLVVPWRTSIEAPALLKSRQRVEVFVPDFGAKVAVEAVAPGQRVNKGDLLLRLESPDLAYRLTRVQSDLDVLRWQVAAQGVNSDLLARGRVNEQAYEATLAEYNGLVDQQARLVVTAPIAGIATDFSDGIEPGSWLAAKTRLMSVIDATGSSVEAYVDESDMERFAAGEPANFIAEADSRIEIPLKVAEVAGASTTLLAEPELATAYGGPIPVRAQKQHELIPDRTIYRVTLTPTETVMPSGRIVRGAVTIRGERISLAARAWRAILAVFIRESGA